jgi:hypothetical protein
MSQLGRRVALVFIMPLAAVAIGCGKGSDVAPSDAETGCLPAFEVGDDGHAQPLGATAGQARAGRIASADLPPYPMQVWRGGDFVLANDRIAIVIEDVGDSDLYDPWGGRPVGVARVEDGRLVEPGEFGELFLLTGRHTVLTQSVSVLNDGSDGGAAVVRATGPLAPLPFLENIVGPLFAAQRLDDVMAAIDYVLEPDSSHVDIVITYRSEEPQDTRLPSVLHGFMYTYRMSSFGDGVGFATAGAELDFTAFVDQGATSYAYSVPGERLTPGLHVSGFESVFTSSFTVPSCVELTRTHARLTIGGPGLDNLLQVVAADEGRTLRAISGVVRDHTGSQAAGVRVHAETQGGDYITRSPVTGADGSYVVHVPQDVDVQLTAYRHGDAIVGPEPVATGATSHDMDLAPTGIIHVIATDTEDAPLPVRVQVMPWSGGVPGVPAHFNEARQVPGRLHVEYVMNGDVQLRVPAGEWRVVVSRGYEYTIHDTLSGGALVVAAGVTVPVAAMLDRVVDTTGVLCGDFHIHTRRSNDAGDDVRMKIRSAVADGLEIPVRTEHEYVEPFQDLIVQMGLDDWAFGITSVEMTSFEVWGHMNVFPLEADPGAINGGTPKWQTWPTAASPDTPLRTLSPVEVFNAARARPEEPVVIINHPRGGFNYFDYVGYNPVTGMVARPGDWDDQFTLVEVFNNSGWHSNRDRTVRDWLGFLNHKRRVFAVGSSDSHHLVGSPVGYPRTCIVLDTDDPHDLDPEWVRDQTAAGHSTISGGIYVDAWVDGVGPGGEATGLGAEALLHVRVQAADWVAVTGLEVVVDGEPELVIDILPGDADPMNSTIRYEVMDIPIPVAAGGSYVIVAAYGEMPLEPVHRNKAPFGVTNPIFLSR